MRAIRILSRSAMTGAAAAAIFLTTPAQAAEYLPEGPQTNVSLATVTGGGWSLCYSATMGTPFGSSAASTLAGCSGDRLLLAGRATGSDTLLVLAQALKIDALFDTGAANNGVFHTANGSDWFNADNYSWGFKSIGSSYTKNQCDVSPPPEPSMCLHTLAGVGGYNINQVSSLNSSTGYEQLVFGFAGQVNGAVPEPATWAMMLLGFGAVGGAMRSAKRARRQKVAVSYG